MTPTLVTSCTALPPEGAVPPGGGPAAEPTPTLVTSCTALPPEGAVPSGGGPAAEPTPTLFTSRAFGGALPPGAAAPAAWPFVKLRTGQGQFRGPALERRAPTRVASMRFSSDQA